MSDKKYTIEVIETTGPDVKDYDATEAVAKLNAAITDGRMIFIDGTPLQADMVSEETISECKDSITVMNRLIGG